MKRPSEMTQQEREALYRQREADDLARHLIGVLTALRYRQKEINHG